MAAKVFVTRTVGTGIASLLGPINVTTTATVAQDRLSVVAGPGALNRGVRVAAFGAPVIVAWGKNPTAAQNWDGTNPQAISGMLIVLANTQVDIPAAAGEVLSFVEVVLT